MARSIDFIVIGAQKAATTTLHHLLRSHPQLFLPAMKETLFLTDDARWNAGPEPFLARYFGEAPPGALIGKVCPQYLADPRVPARLAQVWPGARLVASLRNPVDRAYSHYRMTVRRGQETRSFAEVVHALMVPSRAEHARTLPSTLEAETEAVLAWGEYGRMLRPFLTQVSRDRVLVLFSEQLETNALAVLADIYRFLGVDPATAPVKPGARYHVGGERQRVGDLHGLLRRTPLRYLWRLLVPEGLRERLLYRFDQWNVQPGSTIAAAPSSALRIRLVEYYAPDVRSLAEMLGTVPPWPEFARALAGPSVEVR